MKILLDTHVVIWSLTNDSRLAPDAREMIQSHENIIYISVASLWEIAMKNQKAPELCPYHEREVQNFCMLSGYELLPVKADHVLQVRELQIKEGHYLANHDPFDRILLAQAKVDRMKFLTHDHMFSHYDETCIHLI